MKRIMVVDDSIFMRSLLRDILERNGYDDIIECCNGREALEGYPGNRPDLVMLDIIMPEMNGLEVVEGLMAIDGDARVMIISAVGQDGIVDRALRLGAREYIIKPVNEDRVMEAVRMVLR